MIVDLYDGEIKLEFDEKKHIYTVDGKKVLSVTGITKIIDKSGPLMWWAVGQAIDSIDNYCKAHLYDGNLIFDEVKWQEALKDARRAHAKKSSRAATVGTMAHQWIEDYLTGADPETPRNEQLLASTSSFLQWMDEHEVEPIDTEFKVYSEYYNYAGTCDMDAYVDGERCIVDWKTGTKVYPEHELQVTAYMIAREEELDVKYDARWVVVLPKDGGKVVAKRFGKKTEDKAIKGFLGALDLYRSLRKS